VDAGFRSSLGLDLSSGPFSRSGASLQMAVVRPSGLRQGGGPDPGGPCRKVGRLRASVRRL